jgi:hypothetical protein
VYAGHLGDRFHETDPNHLQKPLRVRTPMENTLIDGLSQIERHVRDFIVALPIDCDQQSKAAALKKLDELVMWTKRSIDK